MLSSSGMVSCNGDVGTYSGLPLSDDGSFSGGVPSCGSSFSGWVSCNGEVGSDDGSGSIIAGEVGSYVGEA